MAVARWFLTLITEWALPRAVADGVGAWLMAGKHGSSAVVTGTEGDCLQ